MVQRVGSSHGISDRLDVFTQLDLLVPLKNSSTLGVGLQILLCTCAEFAQDLRKTCTFLCTDLRIMRGVLLVVFAAGRLGCWWAGLLVGFAAGKLAVNTTTFILHYTISCIYIYISRLTRSIRYFSCADTCANLRAPAF